MRIVLFVVPRSHTINSDIGVTVVPPFPQLFVYTDSEISAIFFFVSVKGVVCKIYIYICVYKTGIGWPVSNCQQRLLKRVIKVGLELDFT